VDSSPSNTRLIAQRLTTEARETRISAVQFSIALAIAITGLVLFACALMLM
jgi:hypothetical protein